MKNRFFVLGMLLSVALILAFHYWFTVEAPCFEDSVIEHNRILRDTAVQPFNNRVLVPYTTEFIIDKLQKVIPYRAAFKITYIVFIAINLLAAFILLYYYLSLFFESLLLKIAGILWVVASFIVALRFHCYQPWSFIELVFFLAGVIFIYKNRYIELLICILFATLNRETALYIPLLYCIQQFDFKKFRVKENIVKFSGPIIVFSIIFIMLKVFRSATPHQKSILELFQTNTQSLNGFIINMLAIALFFNMQLFAVPMGYKYADEFNKKNMFLTPVVFVLYAVFGAWGETRVLMPYLVLILPLGLYYINKISVDNGMAG